MDDAALTKEIERVEGIMKDADDELQKGTRRRNNPPGLHDRKWLPPGRMGP